MRLRDRATRRRRRCRARRSIFAPLARILREFSRTSHLPALTQGHSAAHFAQSTIVQEMWRERRRRGEEDNEDYRFSWSGHGGDQILLHPPAYTGAYESLQHSQRGPQQKMVDAVERRKLAKLKAEVASGVRSPLPLGYRFVPAGISSRGVMGTQ